MKKLTLVLILFLFGCTGSASIGVGPAKDRCDKFPRGSDDWISCQRERV